ncbi:hypothetical protein Y032_0017g3372 [Ancylostoma ceylanicum]|uniref:Uncharacterized protein n=1 Tax=Ancylostoma ceylanicum TaxID=53326 RepID=A0A016V643_9BILA|nr:hypothetical protein Y032_0017g3372 [Ancylostoma ceylanicum]
MQFKKLMFADTNSLRFISDCGENNCDAATGLDGENNLSREKSECFLMSSNWEENFCQDRGESLRFCWDYDQITGVCDIQKEPENNAVYIRLCLCKCFNMCNCWSNFTPPDCEEKLLHSFKCSEDRVNDSHISLECEHEDQDGHVGIRNYIVPAKQSPPAEEKTSTQPATLNVASTSTLQFQEMSTSTIVETKAHTPTTSQFNTDDISINVTAYGTSPSVQLTTGKSRSGRLNYTSHRVRTSLSVTISSLSFKSSPEAVATAFASPSTGTSIVAGETLHNSHRPTGTNIRFNATSTDFIDGDTEESSRSADYLSTLFSISPKHTSVLATNSGETAGKSSHSRTYSSIPVDQSTSKELGITSVQNTPFPSSQSELIRHTSGSTVTTVYFKTSTVPEYFSSQSKKSTESSTVTVVPIATTSTNSHHLTKTTKAVSEKSSLTHFEKSLTFKYSSLHHAASSTDSWRTAEVTSKTNSSHGTFTSNQAADTATITALHFNISEHTPQIGMNTFIASHSAPVILTQTNARCVNESSEEAVYSYSREVNSDISMTTKSSTAARSRRTDPNYPGGISSTSTGDSTRTTTSEFSSNVLGTNLSMNEYTMTAYTKFGSLNQLISTVSTDVIRESTYLVSVIPVSSRWTTGEHSLTTNLHKTGTTRKSSYKDHSDQQTAKKAPAASTEKVPTKTTTEQVVKKSWAAKSGMETSTEATYELLGPISTTSLRATQQQNYTGVFENQTTTESITVAASPSTITTMETTQSDQQTTTKNALAASTEKVVTEITAEQVAQKSSTANSGMETSTKTTHELLTPISATSLYATQWQNYTDAFEQQRMTESITAAASPSTITTMETTQPDQQTTTKNALATSTEKVATEITAEQVAQKSSTANSGMETSTKTTYELLGPISTTSLYATPQQNYTDVFEHQRTTGSITVAASSSTITAVKTTQPDQQTTTKNALAAPTEKNATMTMTEQTSPRSPVQKSSTEEEEKQATQETARKFLSMMTTTTFSTAYLNSSTIPLLIMLTNPAIAFISGNSLTSQLEETIPSSNIDEKQTSAPSPKYWTNGNDAVESTTAAKPFFTTPIFSIAVVTPGNDQIQNQNSTRKVEELSVSLSRTAVGDLAPTVSSMTYASTSITQWISYGVEASSLDHKETFLFTASDFSAETTREEEVSSER